MRRTVVAIAAITILAGGLALAHPHFQKSLTAKAGNTELQLTYFTFPFNAANMSQVTEGFVWNTGNATLKVTGGTLKSNGHTFGPGEYALRARAKSVDSWEVIMVSKADTDGQDMSKAVAVVTETHTGTAEGGHLTLDITGGSGDKDGKMVLWIWFGPRVVEAVFDVTAA